MNGQTITAQATRIAPSWEQKHVFLEFYANWILIPILKVFKFFGFTANGITYFRVTLTIPIIFFYDKGFIVFPLLLYLIALWCDHFDGEYARRFNNITDGGKIIDATGDKLFIGSVILYLLHKNPFHLKLFFIPLLLTELTSCVIGWYKYFVGTGKVISKKREAKNTGANVFGKVKMVVQGIGVGLAIVSPPTTICYEYGLELTLGSLVLSMLSISKHLEAVTKKAQR